MSEASAHRVAVFGAGYVGLVTGACFAELGHRVTIRDVLPGKIDALRRGEVPIYEPGLDELLERNRERLTFTTDVGEAIEGAEFVYVAVGTPPTVSGDADLSAVWMVIDELPDVDHRPHGRQVGVAGDGRRRADRDVHELRTIDRLCDVRREGQPVTVPLEELVQPRLVDRHLAAPERLDLLHDDVADGNRVSQLGEACPGYETDVAGAEDGDPMRVGLAHASRGE